MVQLVYQTLPSTSSLLMHPDGHRKRLQRHDESEKPQRHILTREPTRPQPANPPPNAFYTRSAHSIVTANGIEASHDVCPVIESASDFRLSVLKTSSKPIFVLFTQFVSLTSGTSVGSANWISTHCVSLVNTLIKLPLPQLYTHIVESRTVLG